jgi:hypothetical protein
MMRFNSVEVVLRGKQRRLTSRQIIPMKSKSLPALLCIMVLLSIAGCSETASTPLPSVRILRPSVIATRMLEELSTATSDVTATVTRSPRPTATIHQVTTLTPTQMNDSSLTTTSPAGTVVNSQSTATPGAQTPRPSATRSRTAPTAPTATTPSANPSGSVAEWYPCEQDQIKANRNSMIYHVPGGISYAKTRLNVACFNTEALAQAAGYRRAKK